jgi:hypothetical protein
VEVPQQFDNDLDRLKSYLGLARAPRFNQYSLHHTYFFTPSTLVRLVDNSGFGLLALSTTNPMHTPLWPPSPANWFLRGFLWAADRLHHGGNIIELYARRKA